METMKTVLDWLGENWLLLTIVVGVVIQIIQLVSKHFGNYTGVKKVCLFVVELLSIFVSKDVEGVVKPPLTNKAEPKKVEKEGE